MKLSELIQQCQELLDESPDAGEMEVVILHDDGLTLNVANIGMWDTSAWDKAETHVRDIIPMNYPFEDVITIVPE